MPTSHYTQIPAVIQAIIETKPSTLLEIGIGCGKWGILAREYLDVWDRYLEPWGSHHTTIVGIEIHRQYADSPGWAAYDAIHLGDARDIVPTIGTFDCALMVDVLEHFEHEDGEALLRTLLEHCGSVIVAIPAGFFPTIEVWDNPHEIHRAGWTVAEFETLGSVTVYRNEDSLVVRIVAQ